MHSHICGRAEQYCRLAKITDGIAVVVALDAICYNAYGLSDKSEKPKSFEWLAVYTR